ncbi:MAG: hypothetical protein N3H30_00935 [Candidatus Micrarchaeota archaeon]|nr:hypothetical protein [Candidatus Micrarchaeota archaeon]
MSFDVGRGRPTRLDIKEMVVKRKKERPFVCRILGSNQLVALPDSCSNSQIISILYRKYHHEPGITEAANLMLWQLLNWKELEKILSVTEDYTQLCAGVLVSSALRWKSSAIKLETVRLISNLNENGALPLLHPYRWKCCAVKSESFADRGCVFLAHKIERMHPYGYLFDHMSLINVLMMCCDTANLREKHF